MHGLNTELSHQRDGPQRRPDATQGGNVGQRRDAAHVRHTCTGMDIIHCRPLASTPCTLTHQARPLRNRRTTVALAMTHTPLTPTIGGLNTLHAIGTRQRPMMRGPRYLPPRHKPRYPLSGFDDTFRHDPMHTRPIESNPRSSAASLVAAVT